jgi:hypothetical protein
LCNYVGRIKKLKEAGIVTVMDLAVSRADELAVDINASKESTAALIVATQKLIRDSRIIEKEFLTADLVLIVAFKLSATFCKLLLLNNRGFLDNLRYDIKEYLRLTFYLMDI